MSPEDHYKQVKKPKGQQEKNTGPNRKSPETNPPSGQQPNKEKEKNATVICPHCEKDIKTPPKEKGKIEKALDSAESIQHIGWLVKCFRLFGLKGICGFLFAIALILGSTYLGKTPKPWVQYFTQKYETKKIEPKIKPKHLDVNEISTKEFRDKYSFLRNYQRWLENEAQNDKDKGNIKDFLTCNCASSEFSDPTEEFNWRIEAVADYNISVVALLIRQGNYVKELEIEKSDEAFCEFKVPQTQKGERLIAIFTINGGKDKELKRGCNKFYSQSVK